MPQLIQSNKLRQEHFEDIKGILATTDPYVCKAANIAPLQYVYDILHPWIYIGHEFGERLRRKGIAQLHSDPAGKMLGFECNTFLLKILQQAVADGCDIFGYTWWGPIDIVSAGTGEMEKRYGFIYVDKDNQGNGTLQRRKKDSFEYYKKVIASNGQDLELPAED